jgi:hypothetical protein
MMMPDLQSCLICDDVRQERNGKFILIGIFDALAAPALPVRHPQLAVVTRWCSGEGEFKQKTKLLGPDQQTVVVEGQEIPVRLPSAEATATQVEFFLNTVFPTEGIYWLEVILNGDLKLRCPLRVNRIKPPPAPPGPHVP